MKITEEQKKIINTVIATTENVKINAFAGSGKTTTLKLIADEKQKGGNKGLYLAFNRLIANNAQKTIFANSDVSCKTMHQLAYARFAKACKERLQNRITASYLIDKFNIKKINNVDQNTIANICLDAINVFCSSTDPEITEKHIDFQKYFFVPENKFFQNLRKEIFLKYLYDIKSNMFHDESSVNFPHAVYLKRFQLSKPKIKCDYILFDESQDADPLMIDILDNQKNCQIIYVGDRYQQIYEWRGAVNAMDKIHGVEQYLTKSFRFGQIIADQANLVIAKIGNNKEIIGNENVLSETKKLKNDNTNAILCRTNGSVIMHLLRLLESPKINNTDIAITNKNETISVLKAIKILKNDKKGTGPLTFFKSFEELEVYAETIQGQDMRMYLKLIKKNNIDTLINTINKAHDASDDIQVKIVISTIHRAKGLQWANVRLSDDILNIGEILTTLADSKTTAQEKVDIKKRIEEEIRLLYVAMTRTQLTLDDTSIDYTLLDRL